MLRKEFTMLNQYVQLALDLGNSADMYLYDTEVKLSDEQRKLFTEIKDTCELILMDNIFSHEMFPERVPLESMESKYVELREMEAAYAKQ